MRGRSNLKFRLIIGLVMAAFAYFSYIGKTQENILTGQKQKVNMSTDQEVALGLQSAPQMAQEYGGLYPDNKLQEQVKSVGIKMVNSFARELAAKGVSDPYQYNFYLLRDSKTVNAFALPGGQIFITAGLLGRLKTEDQLAGILGHEIGHVVHRHSSVQMAKTEFLQGLAGAAMASAGDMGAGQIASYVAQVKMLKYGRDDELEADEFGVKQMVASGYNPQAMIEVMEILHEAGGGKEPNEMMSTHPSSTTRINKIKEHIEKYGR